MISQGNFKIYIHRSYDVQKINDHRPTPFEIRDIRDNCDPNNEDDNHRYV